VNWLKTEIASKGGQTAEGQSSTAVIVDRALEVLKDLIGKRFDILEGVYYPLKRFELSYYRNQVIHLFAPEAIISASIYATIKVGGTIESQRIPIKTKLTENCLFISQLMKFEFVYGQGGLTKNLDETILRMMNHNVVIVGVGEDDMPWVTLSPEERRTGRETFDFYCFLIWPFVETYWLTAVSLYTILPNFDDRTNKSLYWTDVRVFMNRSQVLGKTLYYEGDVSYIESVNKETIANAIIRLKEMGIVKIFKGLTPPGDYEPSLFSTNAGTSWIALTSDWYV
jgi:glycerol-3-phosphate O-acyltransferase